MWPKTVQVAGLSLSPPVALAPMVGLSHSALRSLLLQRGGIGLLFTEMLAARRLPHDNALISPLLRTSDGERPLFYQLLVSSVEEVGPAVDKVHRLGGDGIDLNLGCPAPLVRRQGGGAALVEDEERLRTILATLRKQTTLPLSVKIRLGPHGDVPALRRRCRFLVDEGVDLITIHARLDGEKFCRRPRWEVVGEVAPDLPVPVFVNGGIFSVDEARRSLQLSGAAGLMIGRGAVSRPELCAAIADELYGWRSQVEPWRPEETYFRFYGLLEERFAPERRLGRLKQFTTYFAAPLPFGHGLASAVQASRTMAEARDRAQNFFQKSTENASHRED